MLKTVLILFGLLIALEFASIVFLKGSVSDLAGSVRTLSETVDRLVTATETKVVDPKHLYSAWRSSGNVLREVDTERGANESVADWEARHDAAVAALRATYPPV